MKFLLSSVGVLGGTLLLCGLVFVGTAAASSGKSVRVIELHDRCDAATFNAAGVPCVAKADGTVTLQRLFGVISARPAQVLRARDALGWRFQPDEISVKVGTTLMAANVGGEVHTFTEVTDTGFVNSCIPQIAPIFAKELPPPTAAECGTLAPGPNSTVVFPVGFKGNPPTTASTVVSDSGKELYQCLIHPWMRLTVKARGED